jgi:hypothetical protein
MMHRFLVRQVLFVRRGCWPVNENPVGEPSLVCPLCALERHDDSQQTASFTNHGYITCLQCGRVSAIYLPDGTPVVPIVSGPRPDRLLVSVNGNADIRPALNGQVHLLDLVSLDEARPVQSVSFAIEPITLELGDQDEADEPQSQTGDTPLERLRRFRMPPELRLLAAS